VSEIERPRKSGNEFRVLLAETWTDKIDPTGYMLSEKLDGMRAIWKNGRFVTRNNKTINYPDFFTEGWPHDTLDGELWLGRN
jgi:DNA ligase-1